VASVESKGTVPTETLEQRFNRLAEEWYRATAYLSSMSKASQHPAYQEIIRIGEEALPFLLRDLESTHRHWFIALKQITGANPIPPADAGNVPKMADAWLRWARDKGYQW
jgi:hypothetical protein